jgi:hypothetical protein
MAPLGVPQEKPLLERGKVGGGVLVRDAFKSEGLSGGQDVMKSPNHGKGRLPMVPNGNMVAVGKFKLGLVPFEDESAPFMLAEKNLGAE